MGNIVEIEKKFIKSVKENYPVNGDKILEAYFYAKNAHEGVTRMSGEPYIVHPISVAQILIDNDMDYATIMAGLLHDVVEDTDVPIEEIEKRFGDTVARLVDGVTKISNIEKNAGDAEADSIKKLVIAMGNDIRVIFIKLADRLHNMRTIKFLKPEKQTKIANETKDLFIPIADKIGIRTIRSELENLVFECLRPEDYKKIKKEFGDKFTAGEKKVESITNKLNQILVNNKIEGKVVCWPEHFYSIYKKLSSKGIGKVYGLMLYKIIVPTEMDCYKVLGLLHKQFTPLPEQIKDFIASPKLNGYKSLQTVLVSSEAEIAFKVMIRTYEMDKICEYGVSSLWKDKDTDIEYDDSIEKYNSLKEIVLSESGESNSSSFIDAIKNELSTNSTWVFTPKFKPICLSSETPTAIDFAYAVHTSIGDNAVGAIINGKKMSLGSVLGNGDVVEILLSSTPKAPSRDWLSVVTTASARKKIRDYITKHTTEKYIKLGKDLLADELEKSGFSIGDLIKFFEQIKRDYNFVNLDDKYASVGYKSVTVQQLTKYLYEKEQESDIAKNSPVEVEGSTKFINLSFPKCCCAIPGDEIVGVFSKNSVAIHSKNCPNLSKMIGAQIVSAKWKTGLSQTFNVNLKVVAKDTIGFAGKLLSLIAENGFNLTKLEVKMINNNECEFVMCVDVKNTNELTKLEDVIKSFEDVRDVTRFFD